MTRINAVIFDLDNVLYDEREYIKAAYRNIARFISERYGSEEELIYNKLLNDLQEKTSMYPRLFNDLLLDLGLDQKLLPDLLKIYSNTTLDLRLYSASERILAILKKQGIRLGLVTNGNPETQKNKVQLLQIEKYFDSIVYARDTVKDKPDPEVYKVILRALCVKPEEAVFVGDNPYTDFCGAKQLGVKTVRLLCGEYKDIKLAKYYEADITVETLDEFYSFVEEVNALSQKQAREEHILNNG